MNLEQALGLVEAFVLEGRPEDRLALADLLAEHGRAEAERALRQGLARAFSTREHEMHDPSDGDTREELIRAHVLYTAGERAALSRAESARSHGLFDCLFDSEEEAVEYLGELLRPDQR